MGSFEPTPQQRRAMEDRGGSLLVSAAAGSGKTKVLVERLFGYMERERCRIDDFLIITFTKAAAAELRGRIAAELSQRVARQPENMHLRRQMMRVYQADIKTVDAFCGSLLRENIHLLPPEGQRSLTPDFRVLDQQEAELLRMQVLEQVLEEFYQRIGRGDTQAQQLAETLGAGRDDRALERLVLDIHGKIQSHAYPMRWLGRLREQWQQVPESVGPYREVLTDSILRRTRFWAKKLTETAAWMEQYPDLYRGYGDRFLEMAEQLRGYEAAAQEGWDAMARLKPSFRRMGVVKGCDGAKEQAQAVRKRCKDELDEIGALLAVSESEQREDLEAMAPAMLALVRLTEDFTAAYQAEKVRRNCMDFSDQEHYAIRLLQGDDGAPTPLGRQLSGRYREIMVDEYQDTNRVQARLVRLLAGEAGNVMAVGDDAQSIYAFRGADVRNILDFPKLFPGTRVIRLEENYRSTQPVLDVANAVLAPASEGFRKNLFTTKENTPKTPRVRLVRPMSDLTQANVVAARVEELLDRYQAKEIAVLFRAGYQSYHLEVALSKRGIKFRKYGGLRYAEAVHVKDVVAFVRLAINPLDMPSFERVAGLSKGVGTKTAEKIYHVAAQGDFDALRKACTKYPDLWSDMLLLDKLREHNLTPAALIEMVIEHYTPRLQAIFPDDWPRRQQGLSELAHIASAYTDLEQFVADLSLETPEDDADEFDEAGRVVLSTIHSSKGLEWDAVILLDLVEDRFPSRHALVRPEDFEEERRLMYVACTRAREDLELFVPATLYSRQNGGNEPATPSPFVRELPFSALEEWQEGYTGRISKRSTSFAGDPAFSRPSLDIPRELANPNAGRVKGVFPPPVIPEAKGDRAASKGGAGCGYCRHKVFGRGKIVEQLPPDKCRVNFPGFGLKVILSAFLTLEE